MATISKLYLEVARGKLALRDNKEITDYALAKELGIRTSTMTNYMKHEREIDDDEIIMKLAQIVQVPFFQIMGEIKYSKAKSSRVADEWKKLSKGMIAGIGAVSLAGALMLPSHEAQAGEQSASSSDKTVYYVKFKKLLNQLFEYATLFIKWHHKGLTPAF